MARTQTHTDPPRRRKKRKLTWVHIVICLVLASGAGAVTWKLGNKILKPMMLCTRLGKEVKALDSNVAAINAENAKLQEKKKYLLSVEGAKAEARKLGYVKRGEVSIIIHDQKTGNPR